MSRARKDAATAAESRDNAAEYTAEKSSAPVEEQRKPEKPTPLWPFKISGRVHKEFTWYDNTVDSCARYMIGYDKAVSILKDCEEKLDFAEVAERISRSKQSSKPNIRASYDSYNRNLIDALDDLIFVAGGGRITSQDPSLAFVCQFLMLTGKEDAAVRLVLDNSLEAPRELSLWNEPLVMTYLAMTPGNDVVGRIVESCYKFDNTSLFSMSLAKTAQRILGRSPRYQSADSIRCAELTGDELALKGWLVWALAKPYERLKTDKVNDWPKPVINLIKTKFPFALADELDANEYDADSLLSMLASLLRNINRVAMHRSMAQRLVEVYTGYMNRYTNVTTAEKRTANQILWLTMFAHDPGAFLDRILKRTGKSHCSIGMIVNFSQLGEEYHNVVEVLNKYECKADFKYCYSVY